MTCMNIIVEASTAIGRNVETRKEKVVLNSNVNGVESQNIAAETIRRNIGN